jgi:glycosyltransferase involved in cell wall biosynthesis
VTTTTNHRSKWAYFGFPHLGGTFTVYRHLREGLAAAGVELRWLGAGAAASQALRDPAWAHERVHGDAVGSATSHDHQKRALALVRAVEMGAYNGVFINVLTSRAEMNAARYLRPEILRIMIVHNITPGTYAAAEAIRDHVHTTVGVSPRICNDLVRWHGFSLDRCKAIPNAVNAEIASNLPERRVSPGHLRLIYLGRIEDAAKGVFWLPRILARLEPSVTLTIAGDGPDLAALQKRCFGLDGRTQFLGAVPVDSIPVLLGQHDVLIAPSRFEGFCLTLTEAMAAGCVPVASRIKGVTDTIIDHGRSGFLFPVGDIDEAAQAIRQLSDTSLLRNMSAAAGTVVRERFSVDKMASRYLDVMESIHAMPPAIAPSLDPEKWDVPLGFRRGLRSYLPAPLKNILRAMRERWMVGPPVVRR